MQTNDTRMQLATWKFQLDQEDLGERDGWYNPGFDKMAWTTVQAPMAWDYYDKALWGYEGVAWYAATLPLGEIEQGKLAELVFHGVGGNTKVWVNGVAAAENHIRYLPFALALQTDHTGDEPLDIVLRVDNRSTAMGLPGTHKIEWMLYGGLIHPVELVHAPKVKIARVCIDTALRGSEGIVDVQVELANRSDEDFRGTVQLAVDNSKIEAEAECAAGETATLGTQLSISNVSQWSVDSPALYLLEAQLQTGGRLVHAVSERFGVREIRCAAGKVLLNGKEVFFKGVCRYDEYDGYGTTVPEELIRKDLQHIKDCGINYIRVHYPQAPIHYEIADEIGLFYMHDVPICWWRPTADETLDLYHPLVRESIQAVDRMAALYYNHPSWVVWSMSNESNTQVPAGEEMMKTLMQRARQVGGNRMMTWVCDHRPRKGEFNGADLVSVNVYYGIHHGERADYIHQFEELVAQPTREYLARLAADYPGLPILVAEFGTVGVYGMHGNARLTEEFQAAFIKSTWEAIVSSTNICGTVLWSWADYYHRKDFFGEGNHINTPFGPYGAVTVDRKIKSKPYEMVRRLFHG